MKYYEYRDVESKQLRVCNGWGLKDPINGSTALKQTEKAQEELNELFVALAKLETLKSVKDLLPDYEAMVEQAMAEVKDAIGDVQVCMVNVCDQLDVDLVHDCYGPAVDVISKRTGRMIKGKFHKDA